MWGLPRASLGCLLGPGAEPAPEWEVEPRLFRVPFLPPLFISSSPTWFKMVRRNALLGKLGWP